MASSITRAQLAKMGLTLKDKKTVSTKELSERGQKLKKEKNPERSEKSKARWQAQPDEVKQASLRRLAAGRAFRILTKQGVSLPRPDYVAIASGEPFPPQIAEYLQNEGANRQKMIESGELIKSKKSGKYYKKKAPKQLLAENAIEIPITEGVQAVPGSSALVNEITRNGQKSVDNDSSGAGLYPPGAQYMGNGKFVGTSIGAQYMGNGKFVGTSISGPRQPLNKDIVYYAPSGNHPGMEGKGPLGKFIGSTIGGIAGGLLF